MSRRKQLKPKSVKAEEIHDESAEMEGQFDDKVIIEKKSIFVPFESSPCKMNVDLSEERSEASKEDGMLVIDERGIQNTSTEQATFDTSSYEDEATNTSLNNTPNKNTITKNLFLENIGKNFFDNNFINNKNFSPSKLFNCDNNISTQPDAFTANSLNFLAGIRLLKSSPNVLPIKTTLPSAVLISPQTNINKNNNTTTSTKHNINKSRRKSDRILPLQDGLGQSMFRCPVCDEELFNNHDFTMHIRSHNSTNEVSSSVNACKICGKVLSSMSSLDRHMLVHSGERPFQCRICHMAFTTNGNMHRHMRIHSKEDRHLQQILHPQQLQQITSSTLSNQSNASSISTSINNLNIQGSQHQQFSNQSQLLNTPLKIIAPQHHQKILYRHLNEKEDLILVEKGFTKDGVIQYTTLKGKKTNSFIPKLKVTMASRESVVSSDNRPPEEASECNALTILVDPSSWRHKCQICADGRLFYSIYGLLEHLLDHEVKQTNDEAAKKDKNHDFNGKSINEVAVAEGKKKLTFFLRCFLCGDIHNTVVDLKEHIQLEHPTSLSSPHFFWPFTQSKVVKHCASNVKKNESLIRGIIDFKNISFRNEESKDVFLNNNANDNNCLYSSSPVMCIPFSTLKYPLIAHKYKLNDISFCNNNDQFINSVGSINDAEKTDGKMENEDNVNSINSNIEENQTILDAVKTDAMIDMNNNEISNGGFQSSTADKGSVVENTNDVHEKVVLKEKSILQNGVSTAALVYNGVKAVDDEIDENSCKSQMDEKSLSEQKLFNLLSQNMSSSSSSSSFKNNSNKALSCFCGLYFMTMQQLENHQLTNHIKDKILEGWGLDAKNKSEGDTRLLIDQREFMLLNGLKSGSRKELPDESKGLETQSNWLSSSLCLLCNQVFVMEKECERHLRKKHHLVVNSDIQKNIKHFLVANTNSSSDIINSGSIETHCNKNYHNAKKETSNICKYCGEDFKVPRALKHHLRSQTSCLHKPFTCKACGIGFSTKANSLRHVSKQHPFLSSPPDLHINHHTPNKSTITDNIKNINSTDKKNNMYSNIRAKKQTYPGNSTLLYNIVPGSNINNFENVIPSLSKHIKLFAEERFCENSTTSNNSTDSTDLMGPYNKHQEGPLDFSFKKVKLEKVDDDELPMDLSQRSDDKRQAGTSINLKYKLKSILNPIKTHKAAKHLTKRILLPLKQGSSNNYNNDSSKTLSSFLSCNPHKCTRCSFSFNSQVKLQSHLATCHPDLSISSVEALPPSSNPHSLENQILKLNKVNIKEEKIDDDNETSKTPVKSFQYHSSLKSSPSRPFFHLFTNLRHDLFLANKNNLLSDPELSKKLELLSDQLMADSSMEKADKLETLMELKGGNDGGKEKVLEAQNSDWSPEQTEDRVGDARSKSSYSETPHKIKCCYCPRAFPWVSSLKRHLLTHTGHKPFVCPKCSVTFSTKSNRERHMVRKHGCRDSITLSEAFQHKTLQHQFFTPTFLNDVNKKASGVENNMNIHDEEEEEEGGLENGELKGNLLVIEPDDVRGTNDDDANKHSIEHKDINNNNKTISTFVLESASFSPQANDVLPRNYRFSVQGNQHKNPERDNYNVDKITHCWKCDVKFESRKSLLRHLREHNIDLPFKCYLCDASFAHRIDSLGHKATHHSSDWAAVSTKNKVGDDLNIYSTFIDTIVSEILAGNFKNQTISCTQVGVDLEVKPENDYAQRKVYCSLCPKRFWSLQDLRRHMRSHTGERPFECDICQSRFTLKHSMMRHRRKHNSFTTKIYKSNKTSSKNIPKTILTFKTQNGVPVNKTNETTTNTIKDPTNSLTTTTTNNEDGDVLNIAPQGEKIGYDAGSYVDKDYVARLLINSEISKEEEEEKEEDITHETFDEKDEEEADDEDTKYI